jgi:hypothetical protein
MVSKIQVISLILVLNLCVFDSTLLSKRIRRRTPIFLKSKFGDKCGIGSRDHDLPVFVKCRYCLSQRPFFSGCYFDTAMDDCTRDKPSKLIIDNVLSCPVNSRETLIESMFKKASKTPTEMDVCDDSEAYFRAKWANMLTMIKTNLRRHSPSDVKPEEVFRTLYDAVSTVLNPSSSLGPALFDFMKDQFSDYLKERISPDESVYSYAVFQIEFTSILEECRYGIKAPQLHSNGDLIKYVDCDPCKVLSMKKAIKRMSSSDYKELKDELEEIENIKDVSNFVNKLKKSITKWEVD